MRPRRWRNRMGSAASRVALVQHEVVAVGIAEQRHVAHAGVEGVAQKLDALALELSASLLDVVDVEGGMRVALRHELHAHPLRLPDSEAGVADPELEACVV